MAEVAAGSWRLSAAARRWLIAAVLLVQCLMPLWLSVGDHPLWAPDEGRYGSVSMNMLSSGDWLVPTMDGQPHLTKPPLLYWLQAGCMRLLGEDEFALRLPSLLAATFTVLITFAIGAHWAGVRRGLLASGLLSITPLHLVVGHLAITDSLLTLCWTGALGAGVMALHTGEAPPNRAQPDRSRQWATLMWVAVSVGLLTKGPLALAPVGVLLLWLAINRRWSAARRLRIIAGLPLALIPLSLWVALIISRDAGALAIWKHEMLDRAAGSGDHTEPLWYYIPILIAGLFPATASLSLPGIDFPWREARQRCRAADLGCLFGLAVVVPFIGFSLMGGKLATYILPLAPPLALLAAGVLESRFFSESGDRRAERKVHQMLLTIAISTALLVIAMLVLSLRLFPDGAWDPLIAAAAPIVALAIWFSWPHIAASPRRCAGALVVLWLSGAVAWIGAFEFEDAFTRHYGTQPLIAQVQSQPDLADPIIATVGYEDQTLFRYLNHPAQTLKNSQIQEWLDSLSQTDRSRAALLAKEDVWVQIVQKRPDVAGLFEAIGRGTYRIDTPIIILRPRRD